MSQQLVSCSSDHCWHWCNNLAYTTYPAQFEEICCHCGTRRMSTQAVYAPATHGPYVPSPSGPAVTYNGTDTHYRITFKTDGLDG